MTAYANDELSWFDAQAAEYDDEEPCEPEEPPTWQRVVGHTREDGRVMAYVSTNDNLDLGYPSEYASWTTRYSSAESFRQHAGYTRVGILGCRVTVTLDGEEQHPPAEMARRARVKDLGHHLAGELQRLLGEFPGATAAEVLSAMARELPSDGD